MKYHFGLAALIALTILSAAAAREPLLIAPVYVEYTSATPAEFAEQAKELKKRIGPKPNVLVGFSAFLRMTFRPSDIEEADRIVDRARLNNVPVHISIMSGFFHGYTPLRESMIRADVRNAQWFSDGWIASPEDFRQSDAVPRSVWITPSRNAQTLRRRLEDGTRGLGKHLTDLMERYPETLLSISGDSEVEFSYERNLDSGERPRGGDQIVYADYSPFMIAEFRDWLRNNRYRGDQSPGSDDDRDGHTLNQDFRQQFRTWQLRYFDESGPIPFQQYRAMPDKLPRSGPYFIEGGFDAPRTADAANPFWKAWRDFRVRAIANYLHDFGEWITNGKRMPSRFYSHQIPADYLFGGIDTVRIETSASPLQTAFIQPLGSAGVTVFNTFNGSTHSKTSSPALFRRLQQSGAYWGILEYNPSVPATGEEAYYTAELRSLYAFHPTIIAPFAWTNSDDLRKYRIQDTAFEHALKKFIEEISRR